MSDKQQLFLYLNKQQTKLFFAKPEWHIWILNPGCWLAEMQSDKGKKMNLILAPWSFEGKIAERFNRTIKVKLDQTIKDRAVRVELNFEQEDQMEILIVKEITPIETGFIQRGIGEEVYGEDY